MSREKIEMDVHFESTMDAIVRTLESARMSKGSDNPQVFEVKFKLPNMDSVVYLATSSSSL